jgi:hypothetical protein
MFKSNDVGAEIHGSSSPDSFDNCYFFSSLNMGMYCETNDTINVPLSIISCGFYRNQIASQSRNRSLVFTCSILGYNNTGILLNNAQLICGAGSGVQINSDTISSGFNTFAFQDGPSIKAYNAKLYLNGKNNILRSIDKKSTIYEFSGSLASANGGNSSSQKNEKLNLGENYWQPTKWNYNIDSIQDRYVNLGYYDIGGHYSEIELTGKLSSTQFVKCYDPNGSVSSAMKLAGLDNEFQELQLNNGVKTNDFINPSINWPQNAKIFTVDGKLIRNGETINTSSNYDFGLSPGIYIVQWQDGEKSFQSKKIIVSEK